MKILNSANYTRYQERTSTFLGEVNEYLEKNYNGDLRKLRDKPDKDQKKFREKLKDFKGMGDVAVDIFNREAQQVTYILQMDIIQKDFSEKDFSRLFAAFVRMNLNKD